MSIIDDTRQWLIDKHPELAFVLKGHNLTVKAPVASGFDVWVADGDEIIVGYGGWHEHFSHAKQSDALRCFIFGLSDQVRLKVLLRGRNAYNWTMEYLADGHWVADSSMGTIPFVFWRCRRIEYRQNGDFRKGG